MDANTANTTIKRKLRANDQLLSTSTMLPPRSALGRIPINTRPIIGRVLRSSKPRLQPFTQSTPTQIAPPPGRPQLGFLSPLAPNRLPPPLAIHLRQHFGRLISTESRENYKKRLYRGLKIGLSFWAILVLFEIIKTGAHQEDLEHVWPTPPEWKWKNRYCLRNAQALQHPEYVGKIMTNWPMVGAYLNQLIEQLEDVEGEGKGIVDQEEGGILVEGVGRTGLDISAKSEPWRRGYHQALMGAAKAAENMEGWVTDRKQKISAPREYVVGPSNPRPKPMPTNQKKVLHEEDCEDASAPPESYYMKVLTTKGFNTSQKLDAALAYADWLDFKGLSGTAGDMYAWAMDIATAGYQGDASKVVDSQTGILKIGNSERASENILRVSTALGVHNARKNELASALSIFTSALSVRHSLEALPGPEPSPTPTTPPKRTNDIFKYVFESLQTLLIPVKYPAPPPSGDTPALHTTALQCEIAGLMTYIGEIIHATTSREPGISRERGLGWTRDAVLIAEKHMKRCSSPADRDARKQCADCIKVGLENWKTMISFLVKQARKEEADAAEKAKKAWYGGQSAVEEKARELQKFELEEVELEARLRRLMPILEGESSLGTLAPESSMFI